MPRHAPYLLYWSSEKERYEISARDISLPGDIMPDGPAWFAWLDSVNSFAFVSRKGTHCTVRKEIIQQSGAYWYGYRSAQRRTVKRYLGRTADLSLARLEEMVERFNDAVPAPISEPEPDALISTSEPYQPLESGPGAPPPLLEAKLRPPRLPLQLLEREQLLARLDNWHVHKMTLLVAPAGFGKTTLVSQWLQRHSFSQVAWVSLDPGDNDPARFWRYVLAACQSWSPTPEPHPLARFLLSPRRSFHMLSFETELTSFLNKAARQDQHRLLILEDDHVIAEPSIHQTLHFFLTHLPQTLHLVVIARHEPPLQLSRLRANGDLNEIRAADLRFSHEEMLAFLQKTVAYPLSADMLARLDNHLEGWAAGLRLLSLSLQGDLSRAQVDHILTTFSGSQRAVRDYFMSEVLHAQSEPLQDFLLRTSILPRLTPSLCSVVTGKQESTALLEHIERSNLFLEALDDAGEWYRYHALFAEAMQHEARRQLGEEELRVLSLAASRWFEQRGLIFEAVEAALKARENERAASLLEQLFQSSPELEMQEFHTLRRLLEQLPRSILQQSPQLCFCYALSLEFGREPEEAEPELPGRLDTLLQQAEDGLRARNDLVRLGEVYAFRAFFSYQLGRHEQAVVWARQALAWLPENEAMWRSMSLCTLGFQASQEGQLNEARYLFQQVHNLPKMKSAAHFQIISSLFLGLISFAQGQLHQAVRYYRKLSSDIRQQEEFPASPFATLPLTLILYEWNELASLQQHIQQVLDAAEQFPSIPAEFIRLVTEVLLAYVQHAQGETELAVQRLTGVLGEKLLEEDDFSLFVYQEVLCQMVQFLLLLGDLSGAQRWLTELTRRHRRYNERTPDVPLLQRPDALPAPAPDQAEGTLPVLRDSRIPVIWQEQKALLMARIALSQGETEAALRMLGPWLSEAQAAGRGHHVLQIKLLMAQAYAACKQPTQARQCLLEALEQGCPEGYERSFLDEGERLVSLLRDLLPHLHSEALRDYAQALLCKIPRTRIDQVCEPELAEPLSRQEQRVLRLLVAGRSNPEIARELVVSVNTIRTQLQSIYRKLNVHNRHAAREAARQLHLV